MVLVGHQPEYLPYLGFFQKIARADRIVLVDHVQFAKKDFQNRNYIRTAQGPLLLTVPVLSKSRFDQPINEVEINNTVPWRRKHWQSIAGAYRHAPGLPIYGPVLEEILGRPWDRLADLTVEIIGHMTRWLGIEAPITRSSTLGVGTGKTSLLVELCRATGATTYLSGTGARGYVDVAELEREGITHHFCEFTHPAYPQIHGGAFVPNMSAIDLLMNQGEAARDTLRQAIAESPLVGR